MEDLNCHHVQLPQQLRGVVRTPLIPALWITTVPNGSSWLPSSADIEQV